MKKIEGDYASGILTGFLMCALFVVPLLVKDSIIIRISDAPNRIGSLYDILWWSGVAYLITYVVIAKKAFTKYVGLAEWINRKIWRDQDEDTSNVESNT